MKTIYKILIGLIFMVSLTYIWIEKYNEYESSDKVFIEKIKKLKTSNDKNAENVVNVAINILQVYRPYEDLKHKFHLEIQEDSYSNYYRMYGPDRNFVAVTMSEHYNGLTLDTLRKMKALGIKLPPMLTDEDLTWEIISRTKYESKVRVAYKDSELLFIVELDKKGNPDYIREDYIEINENDGQDSDYEFYSEIAAGVDKLDDKKKK